MKLKEDEKYDILDLGYHIALPDDKEMVVEGATYMGRKRRKMEGLVSYILVFKKGKELYGCDWAISRAEATETRPSVFLEVVKRGKEVAKWK